jgi:TonB-linked SusC/RagA family outer membrane protein
MQSKTILSFYPSRKIWKMIQLFLLMMAFTTHSFAGVTVQGKTVKISESNISLSQLIKKIESQVSAEFVYKSEDLRAYKNLTVEKEGLVTDVLNSVLVGTDLKLQLEGNVYVISKKVPIKSQQIKQEKKELKGTVTDEDGNTLPGVSVVVKDTSIGTATDIDGNYILAIPNGTKVLVFSFIGMVSKEIVYEGQSVLDVNLKADTEGLEEVIVVGYGSQKKANLTGAVATVDTKEILKSPVANVTNALAGRLPGLVAVQRSGEPGSDGSTLRIRGFGVPLVIVDGVPASFDQLDPNVIESITILKDAASAAVYGVRGSNGVILVTTKRGIASAPKVSYNGFYSLQSPTRYPDVLGAVDFMTLTNEARANNNEEALFSDELIEKHRVGEPGYPNTNWFKEAVRDYTPMHQHNLNVRGGTERTKYFFSIGYLEQEGMWTAKSTKYKRYNVRSNIDTKITDRFKVNLDINARFEDRLYSGVDGGTLMGEVQRSSPINDSWHKGTIYPTVAGDMFKGNVLASMDPEYSGYTKNQFKYFNSKLGFTYDLPFITGLKAKALYSYTGYYKYKKDWRKEYSTYTYNSDTEEHMKAFSSESTNLKEFLKNTGSLTIQYALEYEKAFEDHSIKALVLYEEMDGGNNEFEASRKNYMTSSIDQLFAGGDEGKDNTGKESQFGRKGYVGRLNYDFKGKYLLEASFRYDASPRFPKNKRWGFFPAVSAGWRISEEAFITNNLPQITNLKLRGSWGQLGYDGDVNYQWLSAYKQGGKDQDDNPIGGKYVFGDEVVAGVESTGLANPNITWERSTSSNIGLDIGLFDNKLTASFDYFRRVRSDILGKRSASLPNTFGATLPNENINEYDNRGFEMQIGYNNKVGDFNYYANGNLSWSREKAVKVDEPVYANGEERRRNQISGKWTNSWSALKALGIFGSQEEIANWAIQDNAGNSTIGVGDIKYLDYNKDGIINSQDEHVVGRNNMPEVMFGLDLGGSYKAFDFSVFFQGATRFDQYVDGEIAHAFFNNANTINELLDRWHKDPDTGE